MFDDVCQALLDNPKYNSLEWLCQSANLKVVREADFNVVLRFQLMNQVCDGMDDAQLGEDWWP
jgi:hypothetical protein